MLLCLKHFFRRRNVKSCSTLCVLLVSAALPALSATIINQDDPGPINSTGLMVASWQQTGTFSGVSITAKLLDFSASAPATATAFLTNQIGAGTTQLANEVANGPISISNTTYTNVLLFSGLTLGPGTYYLVIQNGSNLSWGGTFGTPTTVQTGAGVTVGPTSGFAFGPPAPYAPASTFTNKTTRFLFSVTGNAGAAVPEPALGLLVSAGLGGFLLIRKFRG
jgi:hypothetical protein